MQLARQIVRGAVADLVRVGVRVGVKVRVEVVVRVRVRRAVADVGDQRLWPQLESLSRATLALALALARALALALALAPAPGYAAAVRQRRMRQRPAPVCPSAAGLQNDSTATNQVESQKCCLNRALCVLAQPTIMMSNNHHERSANPRHARAKKQNTRKPGREE